MKWTAAFTALVCALFITAPLVKSQEGTDLVIGFLEWFFDLIDEIEALCDNGSVGVICDAIGISSECETFPVLATCEGDDTPAQTKLVGNLGFTGGSQINIMQELDSVLGTAIDGIIASSYINDEAACNSALTTYMCKLVFGMVGAASGCNGGPEDYKDDLPCQDDCVNFMRKCFVGAKDDFVEMLQDDKYCFDISDLGISGFDEFCPFQIDAVNDNIVDFLSNDVDFCEKLGHEDDNECTTINLRAQLSDVAAPIAWWVYVLIGLLGLAIIGGIGFAVSKKGAAGGDKIDDSKSEYSQASEATRADF